MKIGLASCLDMGWFLPNARGSSAGMALGPELFGISLLALLIYWTLNLAAARSVYTLGGDYGALLGSCTIDETLLWGFFSRFFCFGWWQRPLAGSYAVVGPWNGPANMAFVPWF